MFGTSNNWVGMWYVETGGYLPQTWVAHTDSVTCIKMLSPTLLVSGSSDSRLFVWNITNAIPNVTVSFLQHTASVTGLDRLPTGNMVSVSQDMSVRIWNPMNGAAIYTKTSAHTSFIQCVRTIADGRIATGDATGSIKIWTTDLSSSTTLPSGHSAAVNVFEVLANGILVSGSNDAYAMVWNMTTLTKVVGFLAVNSAAVTCIQQLKDGAIAFAGNHKNMYTYKLTGASQSLVHTGTNFLSGQFPCQDMSLLNATHLALASNGTNTLILNVASSTSIFFIKNLSLMYPKSVCLENSGRFY